MAEVIYAGDAGFFKTCTKCEEVKSISSFFACKRASWGYRGKCKSCTAAEDNARFFADPERRRAVVKRSYYNNHERELERGRARSKKDRAKRRKYVKEWRKANPEKTKAADKRSKAKADKQKVAATSKKWLAANFDKIAALRAAAHKKRMANPKNRLDHNVRSGVHRGLKKGTKSSRHTYGLLGYTAEELMLNLEQQFQPGMTWDNYGEWHVDHRIPLSSFKYDTPDCPDFRAAWALSNLQPLWEGDNCSKNNKRLYLL